MKHNLHYKMVYISNSSKLNDNNKHQMIRIKISKEEYMKKLVKWIDRMNEYMKKNLSNGLINE